MIFGYNSQSNAHFYHDSKILDKNFWFESVNLFNLRLIFQCFQHITDENIKLAGLLIFEKNFLNIRMIDVEKY